MVSLTVRSHAYRFARQYISHLSPKGVSARFKDNGPTICVRIYAAPISSGSKRSKRGPAKSKRVSEVRYGWSFSRLEPDDEIFETHGVCFATDPASAPFVEGAVIDIV